LVQSSHQPGHRALRLAGSSGSPRGARSGAAARALGEDTLTRLHALIGKVHPVALGCAANLPLDLRADGAADRLAADTMNGYAQTLGSDHPDAVAAASGRRLDFDFDPPNI
jgi:hypothetical protein